MPRLRRLSGSEVVAILARFGFQVISQRGSHLKLQRLTAAGHRQTLHIPNHQELDTGTCRAIIRQAGRYVPEGELLPHFVAN